MDKNDLLKIISKGESENVEFKKTTGQRTEAAKAACAFLNGEGGVIVFGASDKGELFGQEVTNKTLLDVSHELRLIDPPIFLRTETVDVMGSNKAIVVQVPGKRGCYTYDGRPYLRHGSMTQIMPRNEYERRLIESAHPLHRWENLPVPEGITIEDLDEEEIRKTIASAINLGRGTGNSPEDSLESILISLNLIEKGKLLNAAVALYGKKPLGSFYPQFSILLARFKGNDRLEGFRDNRKYWGHAFHLFRLGESFFSEYLPIGSELIPGKMIRQDYPIYPPLALREALANAICHRDYASPSGSIAIGIYDNHLEIINSGTLHFDLKPDNFFKGPHASKPWNPLIAGVFYRAGIIEQWGSGTRNIIRWCQENQNPLPQCEEQLGQAVVVSFFPSAFFSETKPGELPAGGVKNQTQLTEKDKICDFCKSPKTAKEIMSLLGINRRETLYKHLKPLIDNNIIFMTMPQTPKIKGQKYFTNPNL